MSRNAILSSLLPLFLASAVGSAAEGQWQFVGASGPCSLLGMIAGEEGEALASPHSLAVLDIGSADPSIDGLKGELVAMLYLDGGAFDAGKQPETVRIAGVEIRSKGQSENGFVFEAFAEDAEAVLTSLEESAELRLHLSFENDNPTREMHWRFRVDEFRRHKELFDACRVAPGM